MPTNLYASLRHRVMDQCFKNPGKKYFWQDLSEACANAIYEFDGKDIASISRKTIYNDMKYLKSEAGGSAPIVGLLDGGKKYYTYEDKSFSIYNNPLNAAEIDGLKDAILLFSRIGGLQEFDWLQSVIPKLHLAIDNKHEGEIIQYENNIDLKNNHLIPEIFNHIRYKRVLHIHYKTFSGEKLEVLMHPHLLKQYNNRWFLFGEVPSIRKKDDIHPINFPLDRIESIEASAEKYRINKEIDYTEYFEGFLGVSKEGKKPYKIIFRVHNNRYKYVGTKPIHLTQKVFKQVGSTDWYESSINLIPNRELYQTFLSFGSDLIVVSPKSVRDKMNEFSKKMIDNYK